MGGGQIMRADGYYMPDLFRFLEEISRDNSREFFAANRERYNRLRRGWYADLDRLIGAMSAWNPAMASQTPSTATYRFNRDTRFSPDKSPYKTFFSATLSPYSRKIEHAGHYIQIGTPGNEDNGLWGGIYCPSAPLLNLLRRDIVDNIDEFRGILSEPSLRKNYPEWVGQRLKTTPKGWPKDHPEIDLLRLKEYGRFHHVSPEFFLDPDWPPRASEIMKSLQPLIDFLNYTVFDPRD
ncbi:MAG: DUF2461 domain-containing protein [Clostridium sp.]|nr:DUF2461 domain-containing protein [Clostridium sp.]